MGGHGILDRYTFKKNENIACLYKAMVMFLIQKYNSSRQMLKRYHVTFEDTKSCHLHVYIEGGHTMQWQTENKVII